MNNIKHKWRHQSSNPWGYNSYSRPTWGSATRQMSHSKKSHLSHSKWPATPSKRPYQIVPGLHVLGVFIILIGLLFLKVFSCYFWCFFLVLSRNGTRKTRLFGHRILEKLCDFYRAFVAAFSCFVSCPGANLACLRNSGFATVGPQKLQTHSVLKFEFLSETGPSLHNKYSFWAPDKTATMPGLQPDAAGLNLFATFCTGSCTKPHDPLGASCIW